MFVGEFDLMFDFEWGQKIVVFFGIVVGCGALKWSENGRGFNSVGGGVVLKTGGNGGETSGKVAELSYTFFV